MTPMPTDQEIYESVRQAITAIRRDLGKRVTPECELGAELGLESLDEMEHEHLAMHVGQSSQGPRERLGLVAKVGGIFGE